MPSVPVPNTAEVHIRGAHDGQFVENTFYYEFGSTITDGDLTQLAIDIAAVVISDWLPLLSSNWVGREVYARDLTSGSGLEATDTSIFGEVGTSTGPDLPNNATIAIARKSGLAGRSFRGRVFWQALTASMVTTANNLNSAVGLDIIDAINAVDAAAILLDWTPVIVSLFTGGAPRVSGVTTPITSWSLTNLVLDGQRRRLPGRGL